MFARIAGVTAAVLIVLLGSLYIRLFLGPVSLGFLAQPIESSIASELSGLGVKIETVALQMGDRGQLEFALKNVRVTDADDVVLALAPSASISLSRRALMLGRIAPENIDLIAPRLLLFYNDEGTLSVKFSPPGEPADTAKPPVAMRGPVDAGPAPDKRVDGAAGDGADVLGRIDLVKVLSQASASARRREHASAYLREIGLRSATVIVDNGARKSIWRVPELDVDLDHRRSRSSIAGRAKIESLTGPWEINFRTYEHESAKTINLAVSVQGLVPRGLARALPQLAALEGLDLPIWGEARLSLSPAGEIVDGKIDIDAAPGQVVLPWLAGRPLRVDGAHLEMSYASATRRFDIAPSVLVWGDSRVQFAGNAVFSADGPDGAGWNVELRSEGGWLGAEPPLYPRLQIEDWSARGFVSPARGHAVLRQFRVLAGGAEITAQGDVSDMAGAMSARLEGRIGAMPANTLKAIWPSALAPQTRAWIATRLVRGNIQGGSFKLSSGAQNGAAGSTAVTGTAERASLTLEGANLALTVLDGGLPLDIPRALLRLDDHALEITVPDASLAVPDGRRLGLKGTFAVNMNDPQPRVGQIALKVQGPVSLALELLDREPFHALQDTGLTVSAIEGKLDGQLAIALPLGPELQAAEAKIEGKIRISEGRVRQALGPHDIHGANIGIELTSTAVEAKGEMLVNGVLAKASLQHVFGVPAEKQPPLRITAKLDDSDRTQLGLDINDIVQGEVGIEVTVARDGKNERHVHLRADLLNADVVLDSVAWRKPRGRASTFQFDVAKGTGAYPVELHNVTMVGDNVALQGWMGVGHDHKIKEYRFPTFSLNVISSLEAHGKVRADGVWDVTAKGSRYDGRDMFRALFDVGHIPSPNARVKPGFDLQAEVGTVVGFNDVSLQNVRMTLQKRLNKLTALEVRGTLDGGKPFAAVLRPEAGHPRRLLAESLDAGRTFKLVGFYSNAVGGAMNLEVNLDGEGAAERVGTLWVKDFHVLGDPIASQVFKNADDPASSQSGGRRGTVVRERFDFDRMRGKFSVGHGQFVIHGAYMQGPLVGATMKGKVDFRAQTINVGGTYVPLSALNRVLGDLLPIFRPILAGPQGEGLFGITFAIQGGMGDPNVIVNPAALIAPGIFREAFQMVPEDPRVLPRAAPGPRSDAGPRASSVPAGGTGASSAEPRSTAGEIGGSWEANAGQPGAKRK
jgi:hypothetical protein